MYLENIHDFGRLKEQAPTMFADGTISEHSPQSVPLHQDSGKSRNFLTRPLHKEKQAPNIGVIRKRKRDWPLHEEKRVIIQLTTTIHGGKRNKWQMEDRNGHSFSIYKMRSQSSKEGSSENCQFLLLPLQRNRE
ncbi:hypothetical protein ACS0TY_002684 [Phlomoides rotata]